MDITFQVPEELGRVVERIPDKDAFLVGILKRALRERRLDQETIESLAQADRGEYADDAEVEAFFEKWGRDAY